jgi:hypothetical protein
MVIFQEVFPPKYFVCVFCPIQFTSSVNHSFLGFAILQVLADIVTCREVRVTDICGF